MYRFISTLTLLLVLISISGCSFTDGMVDDAIGDSPSIRINGRKPATENKGLLGSADILDKKLSALLTNLENWQYSDNVFSNLAVKIDRKYQRKLRVLYLTPMETVETIALRRKAEVGNADNGNADKTKAEKLSAEKSVLELKSLLAEEIIQSWTEEIAKARAESQAFSVAVNKLRDASREYKIALSTFKSGGDDLDKIDQFNLALKRMTDAIVIALRVKFDVEQNKELESILHDLKNKKDESE